MSARTPEGCRRIGDGPADLLAQVLEVRVAHATDLLVDGSMPIPHRVHDDDVGQRPATGTPSSAARVRRAGRTRGSCRERRRAGLNQRAVDVKEHDRGVVRRCGYNYFKGDHEFRNTRRGGLAVVVALGAVTVVAQGGGMRAKADIKGEGITGTATFREIDAHGGRDRRRFTTGLRAWRSRSTSRASSPARTACTCTRSASARGPASRPRAVTSIRVRRRTWTRT